MVKFAGKCSTRDACAVSDHQSPNFFLFKHICLFVAVLLLSKFSLGDTYADRFRVSLSNCDASNYAVGASWPPATAAYYAHSFSDINAESLVL